MEKEEKASSGEVLGNRKMKSIGTHTFDKRYKIRA